MTRQGWRNLGFVGQFVELPDDVVCTVEYSVRSAQEAVSRPLDLKTAPTPVYRGQFNPRVLLDAFTALYDLHMWRVVGAVCGHPARRHAALGQLKGRL